MIIPPEAPDLSLSLVTERDAPDGISEGDLEDLTAFVLRAEGASGLWEITVALVEDDRLQQLHRDFMGSDTPTDIMTFPASDGESPVAGGDLVISVDHAMSQAAHWGHDPAEEVQYLVVHGLLHLLGWRDEAEGERQRMLVRQQALFDGWRGAEGSSG